MKIVDFGREERFRERKRDLQRTARRHPEQQLPGDPHEWGDPQQLPGPGLLISRDVLPAVL